MKVAIYAAEPYPGGEVNYVKSLIRALSFVHGVEVDLYVTRESFHYFEEFKEVLSIKYTKNFKLRFGKRFLRRKFLNFVLLTFGIFKKKMIEIDNDHIDLFIFPYFALEAITTDIPYIIIPHDKRAFETNNYFRRIINGWLFQRAQFVIVESRYVKEDILKFYPNIDSKKIKIIISPPPLNRVGEVKINAEHVTYKYKLPKNFIIYPAHIIPAKNHRNLIFAIKKIKEKYGYDINLVCCYMSYNSSYFSELKNLIINLGLEKKIFIYERIPYEDLIAMFKLSIALVMPSFIESVSIPIWEAFYLGVPVVSSNVCALPEQVDEAGLLFDPNNIEDMAEKIYKIWTDGNLRNELVQKGYERIKDLTLENYAKQWNEIIMEVIRDEKLRQKND